MLFMVKPFCLQDVLARLPAKAAGSKRSWARTREELMVVNRMWSPWGVYRRNYKETPKDPGDEQT